MTQINTNPLESEFGISRPHLIGLVSLSLGMAAILLLSQGSEPALSNAGDVKSIEVAIQLAKSNSIELETIKTHEAKPIPPAVAERAPRQVVPASKPVPQHVPAVAVKPLFGNREPLPLSLFSFGPDKLKADLWKRTHKVGLNLEQAGEAFHGIESQSAPSESRTDSKETIPPANREEQFLAAFQVGGPGHPNYGFAEARQPRRPRWTIQPIGKPHTRVLAMLDETTRRSLPFQTDGRCKLSEPEATSLEIVSKALHREIDGVAERDEWRIRRTTQTIYGGGRPFQTKADPASRLLTHLKLNSQWHTPEAIPALVQILQAEDLRIREALIFMLANLPGRRSTEALADRALYDFSSVVRHSAIRALKERPVTEYRQRLLDAFRYPWEPVAWHAVEALVSLGDQEAIPALIELLDARDPQAPFRDEAGKTVVRELVKINHLRNCLLCHAPSRKQADLVSAPIPTPGHPLPTVYYGRREAFPPGLPLVRADVTYLRQDFSVMHDTGKPEPVETTFNDLDGILSPKDATPRLSDNWPNRQRFDYLVRTREATSDELAEWAEKSSAEKQNYSQRKAVLAALRSLTRQDLGNDAEAWRVALANSPRFGSKTE